MYHSFLIHSSADGHLGCFQILAIVNSTTMNIEVHISFLIGVSVFLGYITRSGITGSNGSSIFNFLRKRHTCQNQPGRLNRAEVGSWELRKERETEERGWEDYKSSRNCSKFINCAMPFIHKALIRRSVKRSVFLCSSLFQKERQSRRINS